MKHNRRLARKLERKKIYTLQLLYFDIFVLKFSLFSEKNFIIHYIIKDESTIYYYIYNLFSVQSSITFIS